MLNKIYNDKDKFSDTDNNFNFKVTIFILNINKLDNY